MKLEIEISDYLSQEEIKEIVIDSIKDTLSSDKERILSNICYYLGEGYIDSILTESDKDFVKTRVQKLLSEESTIKYELFAERKAWDSYNKIIVSDVIQNTIKSNLNIVKEKTIAALNNIDENKLREHVEENLSDIICLLLKKIKE